MKTVHFLLLMTIATVSLQGAGFAGSSSPAPQEPSQTAKATEKPIHEARTGTDQARPGEADQNQNSPARRTRNATKHRPSVSTSKVVPRRPVLPDKTIAANNRRTYATGGQAGFQLTKSKAATGAAGKAAGHRSPPVPPPAVSVNGQHFRNSRDPGARLAVSGGPLTATRGTAAINGTNVRRKP